MTTMAVEPATFGPLNPLPHLPQLADGRLSFSSSCRGSAPSLSLQSEALSDGRWHAVQLELNSTAVRLTLDQHHPATLLLAPPPARSCRLIGSSFLFGSAVAQLPAARGLDGCLEGLRLNGRHVLEGEWAGLGERAEPGGRRVFGVFRCCGGGGGRVAAVAPAVTCDPDPCQNGGQCQQDAGGGENPEPAEPPQSQTILQM